MSRVIWNKQALIYDEKHRVDVCEADHENDLHSIIRLNQQAFPHDNENADFAQTWIQHHQHYYVIKLDDSTVVGYAIWIIKGGYKKKLTCELEQLAIDSKYRRQGFASYLIQISLIEFQYLHQKLLQIECKIACVYLTTGSDNQDAQNLYRKALKLEQKGGLIGALYGENEYGAEEIMMANTKMEILMDQLCEEYKLFFSLNDIKNRINKIDKHISASSFLNKSTWNEKQST